MGQTLETLIVINATVGNGFSDVGNTLTQLGALVDGMSSKLKKYGQDSLDVYKNYEIAMAESEVALSTSLGRGNNQLKTTMREMEGQVAEWARTSIFHTNDVAQAVAQASHAGWDTEQILNGMEAAMQLSQAGSMDLATGLDYIIKTMNGLELPADRTRELVDMWAYSANSCAGTIQEFGDTFLKLGGTMQFAQTNEELMALTAGFHQMGATGPEAATMMRNFMMSLYAPSGVAGETMKLLGATDEEIKAIREDAGKMDAFDTLKRHGFSVYDALTHEAKGPLELVHGLRDALADIAGGYDKITTNQTTMGIMGTLFGKKGVTGATDVMRALDTVDRVYSDLVSGKYEGYAKYASDVMNDTLFGSIEHFNSQLEELQRKTGEVLSGQLRPFLETFGDFIDKVSGMDDASFAGLVGALEPLAVAGPGLLLTGGALRTIGSAITLFGAGTAGNIAMITGAALAVSMLVSALDQMEKADYASKFGEMGLDNQAISNYAQSIKADYERATQQIQEFDNAFTQAFENYKTATSELKSSLITDMLTGAELKEGTPEYDKLINLGQTAIQAVRDGISLSYASEKEYLDTLYGDNMTDAESQTYSAVLDAVNRELESAVSTTEELSGKFQKALQDMLADGVVDPGELDTLREYMNTLNEIMASAAEAQAYTNQQEALARAQGMGLDGLRDALSNMKEANDELVLQQMRTQWGKDAALIRALENDYANGHISRETADAGIKDIQQKSRDLQLGYKGLNDSMILGAVEQAVRDSSFSDAWDAVKALGNDIQSTGGLITQGIEDRYRANIGNDFYDAFKALQIAVDGVGGVQNMLDYADYYTGIGDTKRAQQYQQYANAYNALYPGNGLLNNVGAWVPGSYVGISGTPEQLQAILESSNMNIDTLGNYISRMRSDGVEPSDSDWTNTFGTDVFNQLNPVAQAMGSSVTDMVAQAAGLKTSAQQDAQNRADALVAENQGLRNQISSLQQNLNQNNADDQGTAAARAEIDHLQAQVATNEGEIAQLQAQYSVEVPAKLQADASAADGLVPESPVEVPAALQAEGDSAENLAPDEPVKVQAELTTDGTGADKIAGGEAVQIPVEGDTSGLNSAIAAEDSQNLTALVDGDTSTLHAAIMAEDSQNLTALVDGDTSSLHAAIMAEDNLHITTHVHGDISSLASAISSQDGRSVTVHVRYVSSGAPKGYATGGRATEPSIFAEAGPEWAIPEEHSQRTAELLNQARKASGFTWPDLLSRFGGLNANPKNTPTTIVYSPVINAQDASGVEQVLIDDKRRLEKWFETKKLRDEVEVYA